MDHDVRLDVGTLWHGHGGRPHVQEVQVVLPTFDLTSLNIERVLVDLTFSFFVARFRVEVRGRMGGESWRYLPGSLPNLGMYRCLGSDIDMCEPFAKEAGRKSKHADCGNWA